MSQQIDSAAIWGQVSPAPDAHESSSEPAVAAAWIDDDVLARAARQDAAAFAELYRRYFNRVYRYLLVRLWDVHQAQDLTAQTFLNALEKIAGYRGQGQFAAWLLTIARHIAADHFRRSRRYTTVPLELASSVADPAPSLDQMIDERSRLEQVARVLQTLASDRSEALALRIFGGLDIGEVAQVMGKSEAAVRMLVHRAVHDLQERLAFQNEAEL